MNTTKKLSEADVLKTATTSKSKNVFNSNAEMEVNVVDYTMGQLMNERVEYKEVKIIPFVTDTAKVSVGLKQKINTGNYNSVEVSSFVLLPTYVENVLETQEAAIKLSQDLLNKTLTKLGYFDDNAAAVAEINEVTKTEAEKEPEKEDFKDVKTKTARSRKKAKEVVEEPKETLYSEYLSEDEIAPVPVEDYETDEATIEKEIATALEETSEVSEEAEEAITPAEIEAMTDTELKSFYEAYEEVLAPEGITGKEAPKKLKALIIGFITGTKADVEEESEAEVLVEDDEVEFVEDDEGVIDDEGSAYTKEELLALSFDELHTLCKEYSIKLQLAKGMKKSEAKILAVNAILEAKLIKA
jgi:hypothetical protein